MHTALLPSDEYAHGEGTWEVVSLFGQTQIYGVAGQGRLDPSLAGDASGSLYIDLEAGFPQPIACGLEIGQRLRGEG